MKGEWSALAEEFAARNNCVVKWCDAKPLTHARSHMEKRRTPFVSSDIDKRTVPEKIMPGVTSIIVLGAAHTVPKQADRLSSLGVNNDYHIQIKMLLRDLIASMQTGTLLQKGASLQKDALLQKDTLLQKDASAQTGKAFRYRILVDSGTLDERALAVRAGLGFYGRNGMVISPVFGSFFHIGVLLTDLPLPESGTVGYPMGYPADGCPADCRACETACPGKAIPKTGYAINVSACISYLTQKVGPLQEAEMSAMGQQLYGCDICRLVCPLAKPLAPSLAQPLAPSLVQPLAPSLAQPSAPSLDRSLAPSLAQPLNQSLIHSPEEWLTMTDRQFADCYGHTAMLWRGTAILRRNALIALGNAAQSRQLTTDTSRLVPLVQSYLSHQDEGIVVAAQYAYKRLTLNGLYV